MKCPKCGKSGYVYADKLYGELLITCGKCSLRIVVSQSDIDRMYAESKKKPVCVCQEIDSRHCMIHGHDEPDYTEGGKYRVLDKEKDTKQAYDQWFNEKTGEWCSVGDAMMTVGFVRSYIYRRLVEQPMKKVFCSECKNYVKADPFSAYPPACLKAKRVDSWYASKDEVQEPQSKNAANDCADYEAK